MTSDGKYVRAPVSLSETEDSNDSILDETGKVFDDGDSACSSEPNQAEFLDDETVVHDVVEQNTDHDQVARENVEEMRKENLEYRRRIDQMQHVLDKLVNEKRSNLPQDSIGSTTREIDESWNNGDAFAVPSTSTGGIRWEHIQPFPNDVPANMMWEQWNRFIDRFEIAVSISNVHDPIKRSQILYLSMGEKLQGIARAARLRPNLKDPDCYKVFVRNIETYLQSMVDITAEHEMFSNLKQDIDEPALTFHARLMEKVRLCRYSSSDEDRFVRMQLLKGMRNRELAKTARTFGYDTTFIVQSATREEAYAAGTAQSRSSEAFVVAKDRQRRHISSDRVPTRRYDAANDGKFRPKRQRESDDPSYHGRGRRSRCPKCFLLFHKFGSCPAFDRNCKACGERGHFAAACRKKNANSIQLKRDLPPGWEDEDKTKQINALTLEQALIDCRIGYSTPVQFLIDSGADANIIGGDDWFRLKKEFLSGGADLEPMELSFNNDLRSYASSNPISVKCVFRADIQVVGCPKPSVKAEFLVVPEGRRSLLGRSTASDMKLLKIGVSVNNCESLGKNHLFPKVPGVLVKFSVDKSIPPVRNAYYNVPAAYRESARKRLQDMETQGIIERITTAPNWISGMSAVSKGKSDFRLVINMRAPNRAIKREYFRLPLLEEMKVKLHGAKFFSKLDLTNAFYHLELHEESRDMTTFLSENGMYRFTRLMFGVNCAPEIFQREMCRILGSVENIIVYIDDVLIFANTLENLHKTVEQVLEILKVNNLTINASKCEFDKTRIQFIGHELDENGFNIDEMKIKDIRKFRAPSTVSELRSFLGLASFVSSYIKGFAEIASPLWTVISSSEWNWGQEQDQAFELLKDKIVHCTTSLGYFSEKQKTILYTDASPNALGAVLVQQDKDQAPHPEKTLNGHSIGLMDGPSG
ncbi:uncharacterized protein LOC134221606 [Armigeres subalbatus]|uniref:uncharacterized protein LOC134221606 n=1 Tax=Armigeres subalbatus TaxID=124917 RepID=UPI002ED4AA30